MVVFTSCALSSAVSFSIRDRYSILIRSGNVEISTLPSAICISLVPDCCCMLSFVVECRHPQRLSTDDFQSIVTTLASGASFETRTMSILSHQNKNAHKHARPSSPAATITPNRCHCITVNGKAEACSNRNSHELRISPLRCHD